MGTQRHERTHESSLQCTTNRKPRFRCDAKSGNVPRRPVPRAVPRKLVVQVELTGFEPRMLATQPGPSSPRSNCVKGEVSCCCTGTMLPLCFSVLLPAVVMVMMAAIAFATIASKIAFVAILALFLPLHGIRGQVASKAKHITYLQKVRW